MVLIGRHILIIFLTFIIHFSILHISDWLVCFEFSTFHQVGLEGIQSNLFYDTRASFWLDEKPVMPNHKQWTHPFIRQKKKAPKSIDGQEVPSSSKWTWIRSLSSGSSNSAPRGVEATGCATSTDGSLVYVGGEVAPGVKLNHRPATFPKALRPIFFFVGLLDGDSDGDIAFLRRIDSERDNYLAGLEIGNGRHLEGRRTCMWLPMLSALPPAPATFMFMCSTSINKEDTQLAKPCRWRRFHYGC